MALESRERGGLYYTWSRREGGRVVREYVGGGELGRIVSKGDAMRRAALEATTPAAVFNTQVNIGSQGAHESREDVPQQAR
jgi:hypothetical protein